jgi:hypothetical protein
VDVLAFRFTVNDNDAGLATKPKPTFEVIDGLTNLDIVERPRRFGTDGRVVERPLRPSGKPAGFHFSESARHVLRHSSPALVETHILVLIRRKEMRGKLRGASSGLTFDDHVVCRRLPSA